MDRKIEKGSFDFFSNFIGCLYGVFCPSDRTTDHNIVCAIQYGLSRCRNPNLIVIGNHGPCRTNTGYHGDHLLTDPLFYLLHFRSGTDHTRAARLARPLGPSQDQFADIDLLLHPGFPHIFLTKTGQDRHSQYFCIVVDFIDNRFEQPLSLRGMNRDKSRTKNRGGLHGGLNRFWNIVKLQIKEDATITALFNNFEYPRSRTYEKLQTYLKQPDMPL